MRIEEKVRLAKKTKDEKLIKEIIKYYEPIFCLNVSNKYGEEYVKDAKEMLPQLVYKYIYNDEIKSKLSCVLRKKVKTFFPKTHYNDVITSGNKEYIKEHYINKLYKNLKILNTTDVLNDDELMMLSNKIVSGFYNNYLNGDKKSSVSNYFNSQISRKLKNFNDEEKLLLFYAYKVEVNDKIVLYFCDKYLYLLEEFKYININMYKKIIKDILSNKVYVKKTNLKSIIIKEMKNKEESYKEHIKYCIYLLKMGDLTYYDDVYKYYFYITRLVYEKYKDEVINKREFKKALKEKYDIYFKETIDNLHFKENLNIQRYVNSRLTFYAKNDRSLYEKTRINKKMINENSDELIDKTLRKYEKNIFPSDVLEDIIVESYYKSAEEYFKKHRNTDFVSYVDYKMDYCIKKMNLNK